MNAARHVFKYFWNCQNSKLDRLWYIFTGGHTLGFAHCSSFQNRIHNFSTTLDVDPSLRPGFAASLRSICPAHNKMKNAGSAMDSSSNMFDNAYYKLLLQGQSIFSSDQSLLSTPKTKALVSKFANEQRLFEKAFVKSMVRMSRIAGAGEEVRLNCRVVRWSNLMFFFWGDLWGFENGK